MHYDHTNYARWGTVYVAEMHQLPAVVQAEFQKGNFVVKGSALPFKWTLTKAKNGSMGLARKVVASLGSPKRHLH